MIKNIDVLKCRKIFYKKNYRTSKYLKTYFRIIDKSKARYKKSKHYEKHHILPKKLFPEYKNLSENPWNKSLLTYREHFICHKLLYFHFKLIGYIDEYKKTLKTIIIYQKTGFKSSYDYDEFKSINKILEINKNRIQKEKEEIIRKKMTLEKPYVLSFTPRFKQLLFESLSYREDGQLVSKNNLQFIINHVIELEKFFHSKHDMHFYFLDDMCDLDFIVWIRKFIIKYNMYDKNSHHVLFNFFLALDKFFIFEY